MSELQRQNRKPIQRDWPISAGERDANKRNLASFNEQLRTTNGGGTDQNRELRHRNNGLGDFLNGAGIPVLCVDRDLRIQRMTPAAEPPFNLQPGDVGRPIADIRPNLKSIEQEPPDLVALLRGAMKSPATVEMELRDCEGKRHLLRVRPLRYGDDFEGAILTLIDIDRLCEPPLAESVIEWVPVPLVIVDGQRRVRAVSKPFLAVHHLQAADVINQPVEEIAGVPFGEQKFQEALARLAGGQTDLEEFEFQRCAPDTGESAVLVIARRIALAEDHSLLIAFFDIGDRSADPIWARALLDAEDALLASHQEMRHLTGRLLRAQHEERRRISRELHDDLSQNVVALQLDIEALAGKLPGHLENEKRELLSIQESARQLSDQLRKIAHGLHPATLEVLGLAAALMASAEETRQRTGIPIEFTATGVPGELPPDIACAFYRIAQEALRNVARHAAHGPVAIRLCGENSHLVLSIRDSGPGFDREAVRGRGGLGLVSMEERARLIRARFQLDAQPGRGVSITVSAALA